jgi:predicted methyltransferase
MASIKIGVYAYGMILSHYEAKPILDAMQAGQTAVITSLDLGLTTAELLLTAEGVQLPENQQLSWAQLEEIVANENACYQIIENDIQKVTYFSEELQRAYSLFPTLSAPTMLVSGITMHRIVDCDPHQDTLNKIKAAGKVYGDVLDTTMGLGYTAIQAAKTAASVITIELDPTVVDVCKANPWSQELFTNPRITRKVGHAWDVIEDEFADEQFSLIIHDPPMLNMAGELYSLEFYQELHRILKAKGRLFHYIGNPDSKSGAVVTRGTIKRLKDAGFRRVSTQPRAFGVLAVK